VLALPEDVEVGLHTLHWPSARQAPVTLDAHEAPIRLANERRALAGAYQLVASRELLDTADLPFRQ
jgi:hypothetical protein